MNLLLSLCLMFCIIPFKPTTPLLTPVLASSDFIIDEAGALVSYEGEESVIVIPDEVITIKERAFYENQTITSVKMGNQVTTIEIEAFANCQNLQNVELSSNIVSIGKEAFMNTTSLESIEIPASLSTVGYSSLGVFYQSGLKKAVIEEGMIEMPKVTVGESATYTVTTSTDNGKGKEYDIVGSYHKVTNLIYLHFAKCPLPLSHVFSKLGSFVGNLGSGLF